MLAKNQIIKRYGADPTEMTLSLLDFADLASDIADRRKKIAIKPNLISPTPASYGATTHPEIAEGIRFISCTKRHTIAERYLIKRQSCGGFAPRTNPGGRF